MKAKHIFTLVFTLLTFFYLTSCGDDDGIKSMDTEPNNSIEEAVLVPLDTVPFTTTIQEEGDIDWYKIEIPSQGYFAIKSSNMPDGLNLEVKFALYEEWDGTKQHDISSWLNFPAVIHIPQAGTYYFVIQDDYNDAFSDEPITLKMQFTEEFDEFEMNNDVETANIVTLDQTFDTYIYPTGDVDFFKIEAPNKDGYVKIMAKGINDNILPEIQFFQFDEWADEQVSELSSWLEFPAAIILPTEGDIYFKIHDDYDDASTIDPITIKIEFLAQMDTCETNNTFKEAKTVVRNDTLSLAVFPQDDQDWFKITINEGETIELLAKDWDDAITPEVKFFTLDSDNELSDYSGWESFPHSFNVTIGTTYYFCVKDDYDDAAAEDAFTVIIQ